jgi:mono/diheme cytochrome c family protein
LYRGKAEGRADKIYVTKDLFNLFRSYCGGCHVDAGLGGLQVSLETFPLRIDGAAIDRIVTNDPAKVMPPLSAGGKVYADRAPSDPIRELVSLLRVWVDQGRRPDAFVLPQDESVDAATSPYAMDEYVAKHQTNLGHCVPDPDIVDTGEDDLDAFFETATELPERLSQTDLFTLDTEELAKHRTIAYVPNYPLWSENAGKQRYVHVPRGQKVRFDKERQAFDIPPNTRFYKTFFKPVIGRDGQVGHRKLETRLLVSRADERTPGGVEIKSLYGTYVWNEDETEATLLRDPLRSGEPFRDRLFTYVTDETRFEAAFRKAQATGTTIVLNELQALTRTYALPGSVRCVQCHMGTRSFVLGFEPIHVLRRQRDEGGVIHDATPDELSQLERMVAYGLFEGLEGARDITPLEKLQGERVPRNQHELRAQSYLVGNCMFCHNPNGFPTQQNPELTDVLNFWPSQEGGIFQFPLDRVSPRIKRGKSQTISIPYISPSLDDIEVTDVVPGKGYAKKVSKAPWQSLVYRNVDSRQTYDDHFAVFPHMPMHAAGFHCDAPRLLGKWMASIVARPKGASASFTPPFEEVSPADPEYGLWAREADARVVTFERDPRVRTCIDPADIVREPLPITTDGDVTFKPEVDEDGVPKYPNFLVTDLTDAPGDWGPRRPDWKDVLVDLDPTTIEPSSPSEESLKEVLTMLRGVKLSDELRKLALEEVPFGLWQVAGKEDVCDLNAAETIADVPEGARWIEHTKPAKSAPVYRLSAGAAVFQNVCSNCHGRLSDSNSALANTILALTGGETRVANLRDGLFGPVGDAGANRRRVFGSDELAQRYMLFMTLGGTQRVIPQVALNIVGNTPVVGSSRSGFTVGTANMLSIAQALCASVVPADDEFQPRTLTEMRFDVDRGVLVYDDFSMLIQSNGDAELWERLCSVDNPTPVRALSPSVPWKEATRSELYVTGLFSRSSSSVGELCVQTRNNPDANAFAQREGLPICPTSAAFWGSTEARRWALRGAMNAGLAVFAYLDEIVSGRKSAQPRFDECELKYPK